MEKITINKFGVNLIVNLDEQVRFIEGVGELKPGLNFSVSQLINLIKIAENKDQLKILLNSLTYN